jgi:imidazolonepropionase-like amidohydrolase|tara:strand:+ start:1034 stop:1207 length:174 start_codon:yes stop_codon:yes gene_type:complete
MPAWISNADKHPDAFTLSEEELEKFFSKAKEVEKNPKYHIYEPDELKKIMHLGRGEK